MIVSSNEGDIKFFCDSFWANVEQLFTLTKISGNFEQVLILKL